MQKLKRRFFHEFLWTIQKMGPHKIARWRKNDRDDGFSFKPTKVVKNNLNIMIWIWVCQRKFFPALSLKSPSSCYIYILNCWCQRTLFQRFHWAVKGGEFAEILGKEFRNCFGNNLSGKTSLGWYWERRRIFSLENICIQHAEKYQ